MKAQQLLNLLCRLNDLDLNLCQNVGGLNQQWAELMGSRSYKTSKHLINTFHNILCWPAAERATGHTS